MSQIEYRDETHERNTKLFKRCGFQGEGGLYSRKNNWKMPVRVVVEQDESEAMVNAITFFVGGVDNVELLDDGMVKIESLGYYHHIGA
jgi:hypothetical protein